LREFWLLLARSEIENFIEFPAIERSPLSPRLKLNWKFERAKSSGLHSHDSWRQKKLLKNKEKTFLLLHGERRQGDGGGEWVSGRIGEEEGKLKAQSMEFFSFIWSDSENKAKVSDWPSSSESLWTSASVFAGMAWRENSLFRLAVLTLGILSLLQTPSDSNRSRISQANMLGHSRL
jgi:hypothetical protein